MHGETVSTWHELHTIPANNGRVLILPMTSKRLGVFGPSDKGGISGSVVIWVESAPQV